MAPTSSTLAHSQTRSLKASSKCRRTCIIALGRSRMAHLCLAVECEPSVPCLSHFVYQMDKVELSGRGSPQEDGLVIRAERNQVEAILLVGELCNIRAIRCP